MSTQDTHTSSRGVSRGEDMDVEAEGEEVEEVEADEDWRACWIEGRMVVRIVGGSVDGSWVTSKRVEEDVEADDEEEEEKEEEEGLRGLPFVDGGRGGIIGNGEADVTVCVGVLFDR